jgi:hypothetical protein
VRAATLAKLERERDQWNQRHPVGTPVEYWPGKRGEGKPARSEIMFRAQVMSDHVSTWLLGAAGSIPVSQIQSLARLKCKTVYQPFASGFAAGLKCIETNKHPGERYGLRHGDLLAIHAAQKPLTEEAWNIADQTGLSTAWICEDGGCIPPLGAAVCIVRYLESRTTDDLLYSPHRPLPQSEILLGDYGPDRHGWRTELVHAFAEPIPAKGQQGIFYWDVPAECRWWEVQR